MRQLTPKESAAVYDRLGRALDTQRFYEDPAADDLIAAGRFDEARRVVDFGCGTGRLAERLLAQHLPGEAGLYAFDVSTRMVELSRQRLARFGGRVRVGQTGGEMRIPLPDGAADRVIATYVLELPGTDDARLFVADAHRVLVPGGLLCLASLTWGRGPVSGAISALWTDVHLLHPALTGGCRPIRLEPLPGPGWNPCYHRVLVRFGMASEILVAERAGG